MTRHRILFAAAAVLAAGIALAPACSSETREAAPNVPSATDAENPGQPSGDATRSDFDTPPKPTRMISPAYPEKEREANVNGRVDLKIEVLEDGSVGTIEVVNEVEGHPAFTAASKEAAAQWLFEPATKDGHPVACQIVIPFKFQLN